MFGAASAELPQRIAFILVPKFSMIAFTSAIEPLRLFLQPAAWMPQAARKTRALRFQVLQALRHAVAQLAHLALQQLPIVVLVRTQ